MVLIERESIVDFHPQRISRKLVDLQLIMSLRWHCQKSLCLLVRDLWRASEYLLNSHCLYIIFWFCAGSSHYSWISGQYLTWGLTAHGMILSIWLKTSRLLSWQAIPKAPLLDFDFHFKAQYPSFCLRISIVLSLFLNTSRKQVNFKTLEGKLNIAS